VDGKTACAALAGIIGAASTKKNGLYPLMGKGRRPFQADAGK
jgi:hypothetical protein